MPWIGQTNSWQFLKKKKSAIYEQVTIVDEQPPAIGASYSGSHWGNFNAQQDSNAGVVYESYPESVHVQKVRKHPHHLHKVCLIRANLMLSLLF